MATSGTTTFNLQLDDIIDDAYERCGLSATRTGYQLKSARRSLNLLFSEWGNRGVHIWKVENHTDTTMTKVSRSEYQAIPNKSSQGQPTQYFIQRNLSNVTITLYLTPNTTDTQINYYYLGRIEDAGAYTNNPDAPYRFLPCMVSGLAYFLSQKISPERTQSLKLYYEDEMQRALTEDSQSTSVHIVPQNYFIGS